MKRSGLVLSALIFTIAASSEASTLTFTTIDHPAALSDDGTLLFGVNGNGEIVGSYLDAVTFNRHSFSYIGGVFTPLDYPSASSTAASDISNSGQIVGTYFDGNSSHGFLKIGNTYSSIDDPAASGFDTAVNAINGNGDLGGVYYTDQFTYHGFVYSGGYFATFD